MRGGLRVAITGFESQEFTDRRRDALRVALKEFEPRGKVLREVEFWMQEGNRRAPGSWLLLVLKVENIAGEAAKGAKPDTPLRIDGGFVGTAVAQFIEKANAGERALKRSAAAQIHIHESFRTGIAESKKLDLGTLAPGREYSLFAVGDGLCERLEMTLTDSDGLMIEGKHQQPRLPMRCSIHLIPTKAKTYSVEVQMKQCRWDVKSAWGLVMLSVPTPPKALEVR